MEFERFYEIMSRKLISESTSPELREDIEYSIRSIYRKAKEHDMDEAGVKLLAETHFSAFLVGRREGQRSVSSSLADITSKKT